MNPRKELLLFLDNMIALESTHPLAVIGGYITDELVNDYDGKYAELRATSRPIRHITELARDMQRPGVDIESAWRDLKRFTNQARRMRT